MKHKIEWLNVPGYIGETWSPVTGCTPISEGCAHCYAKAMAHRLKAMGVTGYQQDDPFRVTFHPDRAFIPGAWRKPRIIFVSSMGDLFHKDAPVDALAAVMSNVSVCHHHIYMLLTKRPEIMRERLADWYGHMRPTAGPFHNLWLGVTAENQARADERIPTLLSIPAAGHFVSIEPALEPIELTDGEWAEACGRRFLHRSVNPFTLRIMAYRLDWVIMGAETGPWARHMNPDWARSLRDQCQAAGVPFLLKKLNARGDRELDGKVWNQTPWDAECVPVEAERDDTH